MAFGLFRRMRRSKSRERVTAFRKTKEFRQRQRSMMKSHSYEDEDFLRRGRLEEMRYYSERTSKAAMVSC